MADEQAETTVFCGACGAKNPAGMRFCGACGTLLVPVAAPAVPPPAAVPVPVQTAQIAPPLRAQASEAAPAVPAAHAPVAETSVAVPVPAPVVPARPAPTVPADPIARERERDRLLTFANVQRMRGQTGDALLTLEDALLMVEGRAAASIYELMGDLLAGDGKLPEAQDAYNKAHHADKNRASAERKYAKIALQIADSKAERSLADAMIRGDSISDLMAAGALESDRGRRNAGMAMFLSIITPGFGQFYNGEVVKGIILVGIFLADLLLLALLPDKNIFTRKIAAIFALSSGKYANQPVSNLAIFAGIVLAAVWLYAIVDAPFSAAKTAKTNTGDNRPPIDKTGWEV